MKDNYKILKERKIWKADTEDRLRNVEGSIYALTGEELDKIRTKDSEQVVAVYKISIKRFLSENKYGTYKFLKDELEEMGFIKEVKNEEARY